MTYCEKDGVFNQVEISTIKKLHLEDLENWKNI